MSGLARPDHRLRGEEARDLHARGALCLRGGPARVAAAARGRRSRRRRSLVPGRQFAPDGRILLPRPAVRHHRFQRGKRRRNAGCARWRASSSSSTSRWTRPTGAHSSTTRRASRSTTSSRCSGFRAIREQSAQGEVTFWLKKPPKADVAIATGTRVADPRGRLFKVTAPRNHSGDAGRAGVDGRHRACAPACRSASSCTCVRPGPRSTSRPSRPRRASRSASDERTVTLVAAPSTDGTDRHLPAEESQGDRAGGRARSRAPRAISDRVR